MRQLSEYDVYIFDCDGVIFDTNQLKIKAMEKALAKKFFEKEKIVDCLNYFSNNFGKSRFHHIAYFLDHLLDHAKEDRDDLERLILAEFARFCGELYLTATLTPGVVEFVNDCIGKRYVASGSEQNELREAFAKRNLDIHFDGIFGSPKSKTTIVEQLLLQEAHAAAVMFGDSLSDLEAAQFHQIDFVFYSPYSSVKEEMTNLCRLYNYPIITDFRRCIHGDVRS